MGLLQRLFERGEARWVTGEETDSWRDKVIGHLNSTDRATRGRYAYAPGPLGYDATVDVPEQHEVRGDTVLMEKPEATKDRTPRETAERLVKDILDQMMVWKVTHPDLFHRKLEEMRALNPALKTLSDAELEDQLTELARKLAEITTQRVWAEHELSKDKWSGAVLLGP